MTAGRTQGLDWRKVGFATAAAGLNLGAVALLSLAALGDGRSRFERQPPLLYLDIKPRPMLRDERPRRPPSVSSPASPSPSTAPTSSRFVEEPPPTSTPTPTAVAPKPTEPPERTAGLSAAQRAAIARSLRQGVAGCTTLPDLSPDERHACLQRRTRLAQGAAAITGSGDAERDAVFARQGARRLAAWEAQRASPSQGDPPCETPHPMAGCEGVNIQIDLFSSRDGFLPNLRKRRK
jgi:hypothetical protein